MKSDKRATTILRVHAVVVLALGVLLALDSWDGLYEPLDLPQSFPALLTQVGGVFVVVFAFLMWRAASVPGELRRTVALAAAAANAGAAAVVAAWLIFRDKPDLLVDSQGIAELTVAAVVLGLFALADLAALRGSRD